MATQTGSYDFKAAKAAHDEAAKVAGNYIVSTAANDVWIHSEDHGPDSSGNATSNTYGWRIGSMFELVRAGLSYFKLWVDNSIARVRVGLENAGHSIFSPDGMEVFTNSSTSVAQFGATSRIGKPYVSGASNNESHVELDYHSLQMVDKEGDTYFYVSDLRDSSGNLTEYFTGDGSTKKFTVTSGVYSVTSVKVNGTAVSAYSRNNSDFTFNSAPAGNAEIAITYMPSSPVQTKAYTLGTRNPSSADKPGLFSVCEGYQVEASGSYTHAEGTYTVAGAKSSHAEGERSATEQINFTLGVNGVLSNCYASHAEGAGTKTLGVGAHSEGVATRAFGEGSHAQNKGTITSADYQTAIGAYNEPDPVEVTETFTGDGSTTIFNLSNQAAVVTSLTVDGTAVTRDLLYYGVSNTIRFNYPPDNGSEIKITYLTATGRGTYALIIGNGTADDARSNAATIDWMGNYLAQAMAGVIQMFAGSTAPDGWLVCDGSAVSRTTYATLFAAIGTAWGTGDGSTTFNLPDLRGRAPIGAGSGSGLTSRTLAATGGSEKMQQHRHGLTGGITSSGTCSITSSGGHTHTITTKTANIRASGNLGMAWGSGTTTSTSYDSIAANTGTHTHTVPNHTHTNNLAVSNSGDGSSENMQPFAVVNFIICTGKTS